MKTAIALGMTIVAAGCGPAAPFTLANQEHGPATDENGLYKNPRWAHQAKNETLPSVSGQCTAVRDPMNAEDWHRDPACSNNGVWTVGEPTCGGDGHVNWFPVNYEGHLRWLDHSADDDYNFMIRRDDRSLYTAANSDFVFMEFDSDETVDRFDDVDEGLRVPW